MDDFLGFTEGSAIRVTKSTFNDNVNFSDDSGESAFEEVEFVNGIIRRLWPDIRIWMSRIVKDLEPVVRKVDLIAGLNLDMIKFIGQFKFRRIDFGDIGPELTGIRLRKNGLQPNEIIVEIDFSYAGDAQIIFAISGILYQLLDIEGGAQKVGAKGQAIIVVKYKTTFPFLTNISITCLKMPAIQYELTKTLTVLNFFGIEQIAHQIVNRQLKQLIVFPNKIDVEVNLKEHDDQQSSKIPAKFPNDEK